MVHPEGDKEMSELQLIDYAMIKLSKTGGLYAKGMTRWRQRDIEDKKKYCMKRSSYFLSFFLYHTCHYMITTLIFECSFSKQYTSLHN